MTSGTEFMNAGNPSELTQQLQAMAEGEGTDLSAVDCLKLLQHDDEEVRVWANECLSHAVTPTSGDLDAIANRFSALVEQCEQSSVASPLLADELYWAITLLNRLDEWDDSTRGQLKRIANWTTERQDQAWLANVSRHAQRVSPV